MVVSCCNHVSHVRSSASSSLTLSRVPFSCWVLVSHTVTSLPRSPFNYPFKLSQAFPFQATPSTVPLARHYGGGLVFTCAPAKPTNTTICSLDLWIWSFQFGLPGAFNDINILEASDHFSKVLAVVFPPVGISYTISIPA